MGDICVIASWWPSPCETGVIIAQGRRARRLTPRGGFPLKIYRKPNRSELSTQYLKNTGVFSPVEETLSGLFLMLKHKNQPRSHAPSPRGYHLIAMWNRVLYYPLSCTATFQYGYSVTRRLWSVPFTSDAGPGLTSYLSGSRSSQRANEPKKKRRKSHYVTESYFGADCGEKYIEVCGRCMEKHARTQHIYVV